jgi:hypothetical protein
MYMMVGIKGVRRKHLPDFSCPMIVHQNMINILNLVAGRARRRRSQGVVNTTLVGLDAMLVNHPVEDPASVRNRIFPHSAFKFIIGYDLNKLA